MNLLAIIDQILHRCAAGERVAVCTVAAARGSTPQKAGAMMIVLQNGQTLGTLGGGCVEAEVRVRALKLIEAQQDLMISFKLDHDYGWDDGLVCGGAMDIAVQIVDRVERAEPWREIRDTLLAGQAATLSLKVPDESGQITPIDQIIQPTPTLLIAGAGHVGAALATITQQIGFDVTVIDDRPDFASVERLPGARIIIGEIEQELARFEIHKNTYVVIVTRGHRHDARALAAVVRSPAHYIGLIGSKRKIVTILRDLHAQGISVENLSRVHAPIGLNLGAITPAEIAISIAAELVAIRRCGSSEMIANMRVTTAQLAKLV